MSLHTLEIFVEAEDIAKIKNRTLILPLEILRRRSKVASQKTSPEAYDPNLANMCTKKELTRITKIKPILGCSVITVVNPTILFPLVSEITRRQKS